MKLIEDMQEEIRKLKAMIVKHEKRIRTLESDTSAEKKRVDHADVPPPALVSEPPPSISINNTRSDEMAPDEV